MKNKQLIAGAVILFVIAGAGYVYSQNKMTHAGMHTETTGETFTSEMHGLRDVEKLSERDFISAMIPHHQEAIDTANEVLARGENAEVRKLAESIIVAQEKEIADMNAWHLEWYGEAVVPSDAHEAMMPDLTNLSGKELDRAFLEGMIEHHMGALMMAQQVAPNIERPEIATLAQAIAETQSAEIIEMRILLKQI